MNVRIMTYNIMHGLDYKILKSDSKERVINLDNLGNVISNENPDIVGLNEVYNDTNNLLTVNQVEYLANKLGYQYYYFGRAITLKNGIFYGNAIMSKYEIKDFNVIQVEDPLVHDEPVSYEHRCILDMNILVNEKLVKVVATHFGLASTEQNNSLKVIEKLVLEHNDKPIIFMGDLNLEETSPLYSRLTNILDDSVKCIEGDKITFNTITPLRKIDYIFSKNISQIKSYVAKGKHSDHYPYVLDVNL